MKYLYIGTITFIVSANICYNLISMIKKNQLVWNFNFIMSILKLSDSSFRFGTILLTIIIYLFILKYTKDIKFKISKKRENTEYGSSRWMKKKEIKKNFKEWKIGSNLKSGGIPVTCENGKFYYDSSFDHTLIVGSTGSGKTICEIMPLIFNLGYANESMIINDVKGELYSNTADFLQKRGYEIKVINLRDAFSSNGWNPLHLAYKYYKENKMDLASDIVENFSRALTKNLSSKDMYWEKSANAVLTALCYGLMEDAHSETEINLYSVYNLLVEHGSKTIDRFNSLDLYFQKKEAGTLSKMEYAVGSFEKGETRATLFSVLATTIKLFSDPAIANLTSRTDFELDTIGTKKTAVFLIIPDEKESRHQLASLFIDQCYQALINVAQSFQDRKMPFRVNFILDEFANMPPITSISNKITVSRSRNIRFYLVIQDFSQLKETYKEASGTIKSNCTNWIYLLTSDNETAKEVSNRLGKQTITSIRSSSSARSSQNDINISNDKSLIRRELLTPDELMRFKFGETIFMKTRMYPIHAKIMPISEYNIKYKVIELPKASKEFKIECFNLDEFRKEKTVREMNQLELE